MIPSITFPKVNKNCVYCVAKIKDSYYVLSDQSYIHKPCLQMLRLSFADFGLDQDMKQFYNFILQKVVNCTKCKQPLDRVNSQITSPYCTACKPFNIFEAKSETEFCELCDNQITLKNKLKKPPLIEGIIMCTTCYKVQTGEQDKEELQIKPDLREIKPQFHLNSYKVEKSNNIFTKIDNSKQEKKQKEKIKNQKVQQVLPQKKGQEFTFCQLCNKKANRLQLILNHGYCNDCQGIDDPQGKQGSNYCDDYFGLEQLFQDKKQKEIKKKQTNQQKKVVQKVQIKKEVEVSNPIKEEKHNYLLKECKICFNAQSQMINIQCRHLMMCQLCYKAMLKRQNKRNQLCCPVCQTVGKYFKYLQPIYI